MLEAFGMLKAVAKRSVNKDMKQPDQRNKQHDLASGCDVECDQKGWPNKAVSDVVNESTNAGIDNVAEGTEVEHDKKNREPVPGKIPDRDVKDGDKYGRNKIFGTDDAFHEFALHDTSIPKMLTF